MDWIRGKCCRGKKQTTKAKINHSMMQADWMPSLCSPIQTPQKNCILGPFLLNSLNRHTLLGFFQMMLLISLWLLYCDFGGLFFTLVLCSQRTERMRCGLTKRPGSGNSLIQVWYRLLLHPGLITQCQCPQLFQCSEADSSADQTAAGGCCTRTHLR